MLAAHGLARIRQLLGHVGKCAGQATELVLALQRHFGRQVAGSHLAHAVGQQQQRAHDLVAQHHRQQHRAKHRQEQAQRERADVHALEAFARQRALLVLAVGPNWVPGSPREI
jgi:hypothetical protein